MNYDIIGDVHGCADELDELLVRLGYIWDGDSGIFAHPLGNKVVFVGDLVDRGPDSASVLSLVMNMVKEGQALTVLGNHDDKLRRALNGNKVRISHGLGDTLKQIESRGNTFGHKVREFLGTLPYKLILHDSKLLICHAGLAEHLQDRDDDRVRSFALYGDTTGRTDENGYPERLDWAARYNGPRIVVHGHVPVSDVVTKNNVWNIDTGCCFGNKLTALRYPTMEVVQVDAYEVYHERRV